MRRMGQFVSFVHPTDAELEFCSIHILFNQEKGVKTEEELTAIQDYLEPFIVAALADGKTQEQVRDDLFDAMDSLVPKYSGLVVIETWDLENFAAWTERWEENFGEEACPEEDL